MIFLVFYLILIMAAFASLAAGMLKASINSIIPLAAVLLAGVIVGLMIYKMKLNPFVGTAVGVVLIAAGIFSGASLPVSVPDVNIWLIVLLLLCLVAALTPIWKFTQPTIYMFFYVVFFGLVALVISLVTGHPDYIRADYTGFFAGLTGAAAKPLWPLLFVTIACGSVSGWHSLVSSSATSKQIENERDVAPVTGGSMLAEGALALLALSIVATLSVADTKGLAADAIFTKGAASLLGNSPIAAAYVGLIFIALAMAVMMLVVRLGRLTISEVGGEKVPLLQNK
jgi:carbon starvation protein